MSFQLTLKGSTFVAQLSVTVTSAHPSCLHQKCMYYAVMLPSAARKHPPGFIKYLPRFISDIQMKGLLEQEETECFFYSKERMSECVGR